MFRQRETKARVAEAGKAPEGGALQPLRTRRDCGSGNKRRARRTCAFAARKQVLLWGLCAVVGVVTAVVLLREGRGGRTSPTQPSPASTTRASDASVFARYGKSASCKSCHEEEFQLWEGSHHALAERPLQAGVDLAAFEPGRKIQHGTQSSEARFSEGKFLVLTAGADGQQKAFAADRVIGVEPLRQYLIPSAGGRLQATELAFDPKRSEWFDVYGQEDRKAGEWGHWTGRGMTWNEMCATCHNTRLRKNYQESTDTYATRMAEMGVGCEACHGPMAAHNSYQLTELHGSNRLNGGTNALVAGKGRAYGGEDPTLRRIGREEMFAVCGSCHSRRTELTDDFQPGEKFFDHFALVVPDETEMFYPDGQIHEEDYELTSFLSSRMHAAGVRCVECHEPHSGKTRVAPNDLCMVCHGGVGATSRNVLSPALSSRRGEGGAGPGARGKSGGVLAAPKIDPQTHSHHQAGDSGSGCVDCHMPQTVYMQRHARHDHGFTIPDPLLTKQFGIPNACGRCHSERTVDWLLEAVESWYGKAMERPARARAQTIARARAGDSHSPGDLAGLLRGETNSLWRAVAAGLLRRWSVEPQVTAALLSSAGDPDPLVRAMSVRALEPLAHSGNEAVLLALRGRLKDPVRAVRIDAAWALHASVETNGPAGADLLAYLHHNGDQPSGALQLGVFLMDRGDLSAAMDRFRRAVGWDPNSAPLRHALAVGLSMEGRGEEAVQELQAACRLAPRDAECRFKLGLALNEVGKLGAARVALEEAVKLDPQFGQAWYNLGLAENALGQSEAALQSLLRAESFDSRSPQIPYARATILARLGRVEEARQAARRALEIQPGYADAKGLLETLSR